MARIVVAAIALAALGPPSLLFLLSMGAGWTFPCLAPDRIDWSPWKELLAGSGAFARALATSLCAALPVGLCATVLGLAASRSLRRRANPQLGLAVAYLPFVLSPVVVGVCLYALLIRLGLAGSMAGVALAQCLFATAFATVFFSEFWDPRATEAEQLVATLGGGELAIWRHAILPRAGGLILVCFFQTFLFSWLDYGLALFIGGGRVPTLTLLLFAYIREGSVNMAALSALLLLIPALLGVASVPFILGTARKRA